ncbi:TetR family transcriptional regulator [Streptomyces sp. JV178]|uniref:TetR/AcrR family transcriptional regulator n=1 Tax=unclassified Streptomyces TaxID=2593676 RepID=UPI000C1B100C|nr:TetR/AcrR family transcriptional regulator [Streptomyces sp. JV178]PIM67798.1 TetR family transcriptional regulator [Streptomyces sp. JV178]
MPKIVDHDARRREIVAAVWALIARKGLDAVTMRDLAAEAGYANGALAPYFRGKDDILLAAFQYAVESTDARAERAIGDATGLVALRRLCHEIMPLDETRLLEARVVVAFWGRALHDPRMAAVHVSALDRWRQRMTDCLAEARAAGEIRGAAPDERGADALLAALAGFQVNALLVPHTATPDHQRAALDGLLASF